MFSVIKFALTTIGLVLILTAVCGLLLMSEAQRYFTRTVDEVLTEAFGSAATVEALAIAPAGPTLTLSRFRLENPDPFKETEALTCEKIEIDLRLRSMFSRSPVIEEIRLEGANIHYRHGISKGTNIGALARGLENTPQSYKHTYRVKRLRCLDARVHLNEGLIPSGIGVRSADIDIKDLEGGRPVQPSAVGSIFFESVLDRTLRMRGLLFTFRQDVEEELRALRGEAAVKAD